MSPPKHWSTYKVARMEALGRFLEVSDQDAETREEHSLILCKGYGFIDAAAATDEYFIQFLRGPDEPAEGSGDQIVGAIAVGHSTGTRSVFEFDFSPDYIKCTSGLWLVASTTEFVKTAVTADVMACTVFYH